MSYIDRLNAAIYLSQQVHQTIINKSSKKWHIWLRDNQAFKNNNGARMTPVEKTGHFLLVKSHQKESFYDQSTIKIQRRI